MISSIFLSLVFNQRKQKDISIPMFTAAQLPQPRLGNNLCCFAESFHFCLRFNRFVKKKSKPRTIHNFPGGSAGKESACIAGELGLIPGLGRSPREGKCYLLQCTDLENPMHCTVHGGAKRRTQLSDLHLLYIQINNTNIY